METSNICKYNHRESISRLHSFFFVYNTYILYFLTTNFILLSLYFFLMATSNFTAYTKFADLEKYADEYCINKAPFQLPDGLKEFLVKYGPYLMIAGLVLGLLGYLNLYWMYSGISQYEMMYYGGR